MCAGTCKQEYQLGVILFPNQEPIWFQMAFPTSAILSRQLVRMITHGKLTVGFEQTDGCLEQFHIITTLAATLRVFTERLCHSQFVHGRLDA